MSFTDDFGSAEERTSGLHPASAPGAPQNLEAMAGDAQVTLSWAAPASDGGAAITQYEYRHAAGTAVPTSTDWTAVPDGSDSGASTADETGMTITSLSNGTQYAFEVRAVNSGGGGTKAGPVTATPAANAAPAFANDSEARSFTETVGDEAVATAGDVGAAVTATDGDGDTLTYALEGADAAKFGIVSTSGQIQTKAGEKYDREAKASYSVTVNLGYGVQGRKGRGLWVPYVGVESGEGGSQALQLGLKLASGPNLEAGLEFGRRDGGIRAAGQAPERAMQLRWGLRW